jgi:hypothetical protein
MAKGITGLAPTAVAFRNELFGRLADAECTGSVALDVNSGDLHRTVGNYPGDAHRMPNCCAVMEAAMEAGDEIVSTPPKGRGATLTIRYKLPRPKCRNGSFVTGAS